MMDRKDRDAKADYTVTILRSPQEVYDYWKDWSRWSAISPDLISVEQTGPIDTHWKAKGPTGDVEWDARIIADEPGKKIAWETKEGSEISMAGSVIFEEAPGGRGTEVYVKVRFDAPAGALGEWVARLKGDHPEQQIAAALRRSKAILEAGEEAVVEGQPSDLKRGDPKHVNESKETGLR